MAESGSVLPAKHSCETDVVVVPSLPSRIQTKAAPAAGMVVAADVDPLIKPLLPEPFLQLGVQTHKGFDAFADQIKAGGAQQDALRALAVLTGNCVACHAMYRLDEVR